MTNNTHSLLFPTADHLQNVQDLASLGSMSMFGLGITTAGPTTTGLMLNPTTSSTLQTQNNTNINNNINSTNTNSNNNNNNNNQNNTTNPHLSVSNQLLDHQHGFGYNLGGTTTLFPPTQPPNNIYYPHINPADPTGVVSSIFFGQSLYPPFEHQTHHQHQQQQQQQQQQPSPSQYSDTSLLWP
jgi:hypothetical protein